MEIREIKIGELVSFIESEEFKRLNPKPITGLRAISQFNNPCAKKDQTALIYVVRDNEVLALAGLMPQKMKATGESVFFNSCWWAHPKKGRGLAIPLLLRLIEKSNSALYLAESTNSLKSILEKTGQFEFSEPINGIRGFFRFYFTDILLKKYPGLKKISFILKCMDGILNTLSSPYRCYFRLKIKKNSLNIEEVNTIDPDLNDFIHQHSTDDFIQKPPEYFEWVQKYRWVKVSGNEPPYPYPFSFYVNKYEINYFRMEKNGEVVAFVAISNRDNLSKIPFFYFDKNHVREVINSVFLILLEKKYDSLVVFQPDIVEHIQNQGTPFLFKKNLQKYTGSTMHIFNIFKENSCIQDGDGDSVFT